MWFVLPDGRHAQVDRMVGPEHVLALVSMDPTKSYQLRLYPLADLKKAVFFHRLTDAAAYATQLEKVKVDKAKAKVVPPEPAPPDAYQPAR